MLRTWESAERTGVKVAAPPAAVLATLTKHFVQIVVAGKPNAADTRAMLGVVHEHFIPAKILLLADGAGGQAFLGQRLEFIQDVKPLDGKTTANVCENYVCQLPTTNLTSVAVQLRPRP